VAMLQLSSILNLVAMYIQSG